VVSPTSGETLTGSNSNEPLRGDPVLRALNGAYCGVDDRRRKLRAEYVTVLEAVSTETLSSTIGSSFGVSIFSGSSFATGIST
jgi:hypothetical protein